MTTVRHLIIDRTNPLVTCPVHRVGVRDSLDALGDYVDVLKSGRRVDKCLTLAQLVGWLEAEVTGLVRAYRMPSGACLDEDSDGYDPTCQCRMA
jgi:hypothetical protein